MYSVERNCVAEFLDGELSIAEKENQKNFFSSNLTLVVTSTKNKRTESSVQTSQIGRNYKEKYQVASVSFGLSGTFHWTLQRTTEGPTWYNSNRTNSTKGTIHSSAA